jgi:hypothetical protein
MNCWSPGHSFAYSEIFWDTQTQQTVARFENNVIDRGPVAIAQLEFAVTNEQVPLEDMFETGLGNPGKVGNPAYNELTWVRFPETIIIEEGKSFDVVLEDIGITLLPGQFLQFRAFNNQDVVFGQHQQPVPQL